MGSLGFSRYQPLGGMNWALVLSLRQGPGRLTGLLISLLLILLFELGGWACAPAFLTQSVSPSPWLQRAWARAVSFLGSGAISTWLLKAGLIRALSPSNVLW